MGRAGLLIALLIAIVAGLALGLFPDIDLSIASAFFHLAQTASTAPAIYIEATVAILRQAGLWIEIALIVLPVAVIAIKLMRPGTPMLIPGRALVFLAVSLALGPGLLVNVGLKNHWGRPRPGRIAQFGGDERFVPWWQPDGGCEKNCSFVSGEASAAFWAIAPAALTPPQWRPLAYGAALTFGGAISLSRMVTGGHFLSDTIFAGVFTFIIIWLTYALVYRWLLARLSDDMVEDALEHVARLIRIAPWRAVAWLPGTRPDIQRAPRECDAEPQTRNYGRRSALFDGGAESREAT
jgi:lipid A 4'-phosphatase